MNRHTLVVIALSAALIWASSLSGCGGTSSSGKITTADGTQGDQISGDQSGTDANVADQAVPDTASPDTTEPNDSGTDLAGSEDTNLGDGNVDDTNSEDGNVDDGTVDDTSAPDTNVDDTNIVDTNVDDTNIVDTNVDDTNVVDTNVVDTNVVDTNVVDTNVVDTNVVDTNVVDTNIVDTNVPDTNVPDTNIVDTNVPDTNVPDTNIVDTNVPDTNVPDTNVPDANTADTSDTTTPPTAFRIVSLTLQNPHLVAVFGAFCADVNGAANNAIDGALNGDTDPQDGYYDLGLVILFDPLAPGSSTTPIGGVSANCPTNGGACSPTTPSTFSVSTTATNLTTGNCLSPINGTTAGYDDPINTPDGPCFFTAPQDFTLELGGVPVTLTNAQIAAVYDQNPVTGLIEGLIIGFVSTTAAQNTIIPDSVPFIGGDTLYQHLPRGQGGSQFTDPCPDARDLNNSGWYFYLNFTAEKVDWNP